MSALVHCDGPGCDMTKSPKFEDRRLGEGGWSMLEEPDRNYDFHSRVCLANWVAGEGGGSTHTVDVTEPATVENRGPRAELDECRADEFCEARFHMLSCPRRDPVR